jgi:hypothetical protein
LFDSPEEAQLKMASPHLKISRSAYFGPVSAYTIGEESLHEKKPNYSNNPEIASNNFRYLDVLRNTFRGSRGGENY